MGHGDVLAHGAHGGVEDLVLHVLVDLELAREQPHHVAPLGVVGVHAPDALEEPPHQVVVLQQHLVRLARARRRGGGRLALLGVLDLAGAQRLVAGLGDAADLDPALAQPHVEARLRRRGGAVEHAARAEAVARAVPGAHEPAVQHPALVERPAHVRAARAHGVDAAPVAHQRDPDLGAGGLVPHRGAARAALLQLVLVRDRLPAPRLGRAVGLVHAHAAAVDEVAAEIRAGRHHEPARAARRAARVAPPAAAQRAGAEVERERGRVQRRVDEPRAAVAPVDLAPVGHARRRGRDGPGGPRGQRHVGGAPRSGVAAQAQRFGRVERQRQRPAADGQRHQDRVERMAQPGPVQRVLDGLRRGAGGLERRGDGVGQTVGGGVEALVGLDRARGAVGEALGRRRSWAGSVSGSRGERVVSAAPRPGEGVEGLGQQVQGRAHLGARERPAVARED